MVALYLSLLYHRYLDRAPDGRTLANGTVLDVPARSYPSRETAAAFRSDGRTFLTGGADFHARLWDRRSEASMREFVGHTDTIRTVAFSPDGRILATGSFDGTARLWDATSGQLLGEPLRHHGQVWSLAFSPDGRTLLTGGDDQTARLWDVATGKPLVPPWRHQGPVTAVMFSPDGRIITTGDQEGIHLWSVPTPAVGGAEAMIYRTQALTGLKFDDQGALQALDASNWQR